LPRQALYGENRRAARLSTRGEQLVERPPKHQLDELGRIRNRGRGQRRDVVAAAQDGDPVGEAAHLV
jgi:hypothetical protein